MHCSECLVLAWGDGTQEDRLVDGTSAAPDGGAYEFDFDLDDDEESFEDDDELDDLDDTDEEEDDDLDVLSSEDDDA